MGEQLTTNEFGVSRRDGFREFISVHPINAHCRTSKVGSNMAPARRVVARWSFPDDVTALEDGMTKDEQPIARMILRTGRTPQEVIRLKQSVPFDVAAERQATDDYGGMKWSAGYVLDHPRKSGHVKCIARSWDQFGMIGSSMDVVCNAVCLAWRAGMNRVVFVPMIPAVVERIALNECRCTGKQIARLGFDIDAGYSEPSADVSGGCATSTAEAVQQTRATHEANFQLSSGFG